MSDVFPEEIWDTGFKVAAVCIVGGLVLIFAVGFATGYGVRAWLVR